MVLKYLENFYPKIDNNDNNVKIISQSSKANLEETDLYLWNPISETERLQLSYKGLGFLYDIGGIILNGNQIGFNSSFLPKDQTEIPQKVSYLLGLIAEGLIVRECQLDIDENEKWASLARRLFINEDESNENLGKFINIFQSIFKGYSSYFVAVGTGFYLTYINKKTRGVYSKQSKRDILWIHKNDSSCEQLLTNTTKNNISVLAGIQVKTSSATTGEYIINLFRNQRIWIDYPIVYFDLGNDFFKIKDKVFADLKEDKFYSPGQCIFKQNRLFFVRHRFKSFYDKNIIEGADLEYHFVRGKDISPDIHEKLLYYKVLLTRIFCLQRFNLDRLSSETIQDLNIAFGVEYAMNSFNINPVFTKSPVLIV